MFLASRQNRQLGGRSRGSLASSLSITVSRLTHAVARITTSVLPVAPHCPRTRGGRVLFTRLPVDRHGGCFHVLVTVDSAAANVCVCAFVYVWGTTKCEAARPCSSPVGFSQDRRPPMGGQHRALGPGLPGTGFTYKRSTLQNPSRGGGSQATIPRGPPSSCIKLLGMSPPTHRVLLGKRTPLPAPPRAKSLSFIALKASSLLPPFILFIYLLEDAENMERLLRAQDVAWIGLGQGRGTPVLRKNEHTSSSPTGTGRMSEEPRDRALSVPRRRVPALPPSSVILPLQSRAVPVDKIVSLP